jgi:hypothetical protein
VAGSSTAGATIADYIASVGGTACSAAQPSAVTLSSVVTTALSDDPNSQIQAVPSVCQDPNNPLFFPAGQPTAGQPVYTYTAGDGNHVAADFKTYIQTQSQALFGANNMPTVAVLTHLPTDAGLAGTDPGTEYIDLATNYMNSASLVSSVYGDYSTSLNNVSNFIVNEAQNNYLLQMPAGSTMISAQVLHQGSTTWQTVDPSEWSQVGLTLSVSPTAALQIGDQLMYTYRTAN